MHYGSYRASIRTRIGPRRTTKYWSITSLDSKKRQNRGQLILAGRTEEPGDKTFGIAIFEALDEARRGRTDDRRSCIPSLWRLNERTPNACL